MLVLPQDVRLELASWIAAGFPGEVCGLLVGRRRGARTETMRAARARNLEHERAGERYEVDPADFVATDLAARAEGLSIVGIWHSHPDHPAEPSERDLATAFGEWSYLIAGVTKRAVHSMRSWRLVDGRFVEEPVSSS